MPGTCAWRAPAGSLPGDDTTSPHGSLARLVKTAVDENCPLLMNFDFSQNHFALFGLTPAFAIDLARLTQLYRDIQAQVHPDRFADRSSQERRLSLQWATHVNEAYETLRQPASRARYLLQLHGIDALDETNTAMPTDFLMEQMEWREAITDARAGRNVDELEHLLHRLKGELAFEQQELARLIDQEQQYELAAEHVRKLKFLEKLREEIKQALEALEG